MEDRTAVGRIVATVDVQNVVEPRRLKKIDALVDTGASCVTLQIGRAHV